MCKIQALRMRRERLAKRILERPSCPPFETEEPWRHHHGQRIDGMPVHPIEFLEVGDFDYKLWLTMKQFDEIQKHLTFDGRIQTNVLTEELWRIAAENKLDLILIDGENIKTYHPCLEEFPRS